MNDCASAVSGLEPRCIALCRRLGTARAEQKTSFEGNRHRACRYASNLSYRDCERIDDGHSREVKDHKLEVIHVITVVTASHEPIRGTEYSRALSLAPNLTDKELARMCIWFCDHTLASLIETNLLYDTDEDNNDLSSRAFPQPGNFYNHRTV